MSADVPPSLAAPPETPEILETPPPVETAADGGTVSDSHDAVRAMLAASRRAEEYQRQQMSVEQHIASLPISDFKKDFLRQNPMMLHPEIAPLASRVYQDLRRRGIADDSQELNAAMLAGVMQQIDGQRQGHAPPPPVTHEAQMDRHDVEAEQAAAELERQAEALRIPRAPEILPPPSRRSLPISAPVSRDIPTAGGQRFSQSSTVTLSKEEREVAHGAYHWLSKGEAEREYALHKSRMLKARADGTLNE
jgi:hypothetical protein